MSQRLLALIIIVLFVMLAPRLARLAWLLVQLAWSNVCLTCLRLRVRWRQRGLRPFPLSRGGRP